MKNKDVLIVICISLYIYFQYIVYDIFGKNNNVLWVLYHWFVPVFFITLALVCVIFAKKTNAIPKFKNPIFYLKIYSCITIFVTWYHYLRICFKYPITKGYLDFFNEIKESIIVYNSTIIWLYLSFLLLVWIKWEFIKEFIKKWTKKRNFN